MEVQDSRLSRFIVWPFVAALAYAFFGAMAALPHPSCGLAVAVALLLGWLAGHVNTVMPQTRHADDYLMPPIILGALTALIVLALRSALGCPWMVLYLSPAVFMTGYLAGAPSFGAKVVTHVSQHRRMLAARALIILNIVCWISLIVGWFTGDLRLIAIGLGSLVGQVVGDYTTTGPTRVAMVVSLVVTLALIAIRAQEVPAAVPMYAVAAGFIALIATTLEKREWRNCQ